MIFKTSKRLFIYANQTQGVNIYIELLNTFVAIFNYFFESYILIAFLSNLCFSFFALTFPASFITHPFI